MKKQAKRTTSQPQQIHWDLYRDGITQSLLARFLVCRHRFWIRTVLGLTQDIGFKHSMEYGSMFHAGLEAFAKAKQAGGKMSDTQFDKAIRLGQRGITHYAELLKKQHPLSEDVQFYHKLCLDQFEIYCNYWRKSDTERLYVLQEQVFDIPYKLPSGRTLRLRGKIDECFLDNGRYVLQENKCKGEVNEAGISQSLHHDLQTMFYLIALNSSCLLPSENKEKTLCRSILYNVILRPNGGKYPLRQRKDENKAEFITRIMDGNREEPSKYFHRWHVDLTAGDLKVMEQRTLIPILETLCDWWDGIKDNPLDPWQSSHHFCRPFGIYDILLASGVGGEYFDFLMSGQKNRVGLKESALFQELTDPSLSEKRGS